MNENSLLFFDNQPMVEQFNKCLASTFAEGNTQVGEKYIGAKFGPCPITTKSDIFGS